MNTLDQAFPAEIDATAKALFDARQKELDKFQTRYLYVPFAEVACADIPGGTIPAGRIHPVPSPEGKIDSRLLPEGATVLRTVQTGIHEPMSVAIYPKEVFPITSGILSRFGKEGAVEITSLFGMSTAAFERHRINDMVFGEDAHMVDGQIVPDATVRTAIGIRQRMMLIQDQAALKNNEGARILSEIAKEILRSVEICESMCREHIRTRHNEMDDPKSEAPKNYSRRDERALAFIGAQKRQEYLQRQAEIQEQSAMAIPQMLKAMQEREERMVEQIAKRDEQLTKAFEMLGAAIANLAPKEPTTGKGKQN